MTVAATTMLLAAATEIAVAHAQVSNTPVNLEAPVPWAFALTPYAWLPTVSSTLHYTGPRGRTVTAHVHAGIGDYISDLNFAFFAGGEARYRRFTVMTDLVHANLSLTGNVVHLSSVNLGQGRIDIPLQQQLHVGTRLGATVWSLAGGYTLLHGTWGNIDAVVGMRLLFTGSSGDYALTNDITFPNRTIALSRSGSLDLSSTLPEGVGGVAGRINIPTTKLYLPFYLDAGGGAVPFTWQAHAGVGYRLNQWAEISVGYRYLSFQSGGESAVKNLNLSGAVIAGNFRF